MKIRRQLNTKQPPQTGLHFGFITMAIVGALTPNKHRQIITEEAIAATVAIKRTLNNPETVARRLRDAKKRHAGASRSKPAA